MSKKLFLALSCFGFSILSVVLILYINKFGANFSNKQDVWGQFGDYVGGVLNPTFSLLAFFALLLSMRLQENERSLSVKHLQSQSEAANREIQRIYKERMALDLLGVIRDIDSRLERVLFEPILPAGSVSLCFSQMNAEAVRVAATGDQSAVYESFLEGSRIPGSFIEAKTREFIKLLCSMKSFLVQYDKHVGSIYTPVASYYSEKLLNLMSLAEDIGGVPSDMRDFCENQTDQSRGHIPISQSS